MKIKIKKTCDVAVIGGGPGGVPAAVAAARNGAKVILVERSGFLGGTAASGLGFLSYLDRKGHPVLGGIPAEIMERLEALHGTLGHNRCPVHNSITPVNPEMVKLALLDMCCESGVELLLNCEAIDVNVDSGRMKSVTVFGKCTYVEIDAPIVIDATGDGDIGYMAGLEYVKGQESTGVMQPSTLMFTVGNVNMDKFFTYIKENPEEIIMPDSYDSGYTPEFFRRTRGHCFIGLPGIIKKASDAREYHIPRDRFIYITSPVDGQLAINSTRIVNMDATDPRELTRGMIEGHRQVKELFTMMRKYIPGFEECDLVAIAPTLGIRETRHFKCLKRLTGDILINGEIPEDTIGLGAYNIDIHSGTGSTIDLKSIEKPFGMPMGCMLPVGIKGIILTGRSIDADTVAFGSVRVMGTCMALGEAAGVCAALAAGKGVSPDEVRIEDIRRQLVNQGVQLKAAEK